MQNPEPQPLEDGVILNVVAESSTVPKIQSVDIRGGNITPLGDIQSSKAHCYTSAEAKSVIHTRESLRQVVKSSRSIPNWPNMSSCIKEMVSVPYL